MFQYFLIYKPYDVLSQFTKEIPEHRTLADCYDFPPDVYPVGRLDRDSEGLLLLTNDKKLNHLLLNPTHQHPRSYLAQVEGTPSDLDLEKLRNGISIKVNKRTYTTLPAKATMLDTAPSLPDRNPPIRFRQNIPTSWIELILTEGKNRQVRKMCAKAGFPVLRLVRHRIVDLKMEHMESGKVQKISRQQLYEALDLV